MESQSQAAPQESQVSQGGGDVAPERQSLDDTISRAYDRIAERETRAPSRNPFDETGQTPDGETAPQDDIEPPLNWSPEQQAQFRQLPPAIKKQVIDELSSAAQKQREEWQRLQQMRQQYGWADEATKRYGQFFALNRVTPQMALDEYVNLATLMQQNPRQFIQMMAQRTGVDLSSLVQKPQDQYVDPELAARDQQIKMLAQQLHQIKTGLTVQQQQQQMAEWSRAEAETENELQAFEKAVGPDGKPKHPYYEQLRGDMAKLVQLDPKITLEQAYDKALRLNDDLWLKRQAEQKAREQQQAIEQSRAARRAGASVAGLSGGSSNGRLVPKGTSLEDTIGAAFDRVAAGRA